MSVTVIEPKSTLPLLKVSNKLDWIREMHPDALLMGGFDDCIVGVCVRFGQEPIVAYDMWAVIEKLKEQGMDEEQAIEYFEFNQLGAWVGDKTPCFIDTV